MPTPSSKAYWIRRAEDGVQEAERQSAAFLRQQKQFYRELYDEVADKIDALYVEYMSKGQLSTTRLYEFGRWRNMQADIRKKVKDLGILQDTHANRLLSALYRETIESTLGEFGKQIRWGISNQAQIEQAISQRWAGGKNFSERIWKNTDKLAYRIQKSIYETVSLGEGSDNLKKKLIRDFGASFNDADRLIRTETMFTYNNASLTGYKESGLVDFFEFAAVMDEATCSECGALDGQRFRLDDAIPGENFPPTHPRSRSTIVPVVHL